jgi:hypothetical protein
MDFDFYDRVWFGDQKKTDMKEEQAKIGCWLGIAHRVGSGMTYWVLTESGSAIARSTVQHITTADMATDATMKTRVTTFDANLFTVWTTKTSKLRYLAMCSTCRTTIMCRMSLPTYRTYYPGDGIRGHVAGPQIRCRRDRIDTFDQYLGAEFILNANGETAMATITKRAKDNDGNAIGKRNSNPLLDTREYECTPEDGSVYRYNANVKANNIYSQYEDEGRRHAAWQEIVDHEKDGSAEDLSNGCVLTEQGQRIPKTATKGWKLLCQWRDGSSDWIELKHVKDSNPIQLAEYALANCIQEEPAFKWWVFETLRTRDRIIAKVKSRYWKTSHKYGVKLPHSVQEILQIDKETGTDFRWKAIQKEMKR